MENIAFLKAFDHLIFLSHFNFYFFSFCSKLFCIGFLIKKVRNIISSKSSNLLIDHLEYCKHNIFKLQYA